MIFFVKQSILCVLRFCLVTFNGFEMQKKRTTITINVMTFNSVFTVAFRFSTRLNALHLNAVLYFILKNCFHVLLYYISSFQFQSFQGKGRWYAFTLFIYFDCLALVTLDALKIYAFKTKQSMSMYTHYTVFVTHCRIKLIKMIIN